MRGPARAVLLLAASLGTVPVLIGTTVPGAAGLIVVAVAVSALLGRAYHDLADQVRWAIPMLLITSATLAAVSIVTGALNGLSDEPYSTPAYAHLGWSMYRTPVSFSYTQYGVPHFESSYNVYLPLLTFVQVPGVDYRWLALGGWGVTLVLLRRRPSALAGFGVPWVALLAANGQNDFVALAAVSAALIARPRTGGLAVEAVSLALKQLANVLVFFYHLLRGEYLRAAASVAITALVLLPFLWLDPSSVYCHVLVGDPGTTCQPHSWTFFVFKRNYWLYPLWAWLAFEGPLRERARAFVANLRTLYRNRGTNGGR